ncbi:MAG: stage II sporulation protein D [Bacillota bacterium]
MQKRIFLFFSLFLIAVLAPLLIHIFSSPPVPETLKINVYKHRSQEIESMELGEYLKGVVAAEMPVFYHMGALKAQAITARTYVMQKYLLGSSKSIPENAHISTNFRDSQAWISRKEMKEKWGIIPYFFLYLRISRAVEDTAGQIIMFDNKIIDAVYHSNSGGRTTAAENVWDQPRPYLKSVVSPYDSEGENYHRRLEFSKRELEDKLKIELSGVTGESLFKSQEYDTSGRVAKIEIAGRKFSGDEIRELLDLPSTKFSFDLKDDLIRCEVWGFGHGVGMSQDGAHGLARHGYGYQQILKHYYQGTEIIDYREATMFD